MTDMTEWTRDEVERWLSTSPQEHASRIVAEAMIEMLDRRQRRREQAAWLAYAHMHWRFQPNQFRIDVSAV